MTAINPWVLPINTIINRNIGYTGYNTFKHAIHNKSLYIFKRGGILDFITRG